MEKEILEQLLLISQGMAHMEQTMNRRFEQIDQRFEQVEQEIKDSEARTKVFIENKVTERIDALVDGYKMVHEKQWELEHRLEKLESRVDHLQTVVSASGEKTA